jgi:nitrogen regulatory protein P-II 1
MYFFIRYQEGSREPPPSSITANRPGDVGKAFYSDAPSRNFLTTVSKRPDTRPHMRLLVFILNNEEFLEEVLEAYVEAGISGATLLDSEGMGRFLTYEVPLFADFKEFMKGNKPYNKTILSVVKDMKTVKRLIPLVEASVGSLDEGGTGIMFTIPVDWAAGLVRSEGDEE